jgi:hypothetical protein
VSFGFRRPEIPELTRRCEEVRRVWVRTLSLASAVDVDSVAAECKAADRHA